MFTKKSNCLDPHFDQCGDYTVSKKYINKIIKHYFCHIRLDHLLEASALSEVLLHYSTLFSNDQLKNLHTVSYFCRKYTLPAQHKTLFYITKQSLINALKCVAHTLYQISKKKLDINTLIDILAMPEYPEEQIKYYIIEIIDYSYIDTFSNTKQTVVPRLVSLFIKHLHTIPVPYEPYTFISDINEIHQCTVSTKSTAEESQPILENPITENLHQISTVNMSHAILSDTMPLLPNQLVQDDDKAIKLSHTPTITLNDKEKLQKIPLQQHL